MKHLVLLKMFYDRLYKRPDRYKMGTDGMGMMLVVNQGDVTCQNT